MQDEATLVSDRDPYLDNLKGILIALVVFGHSLELMTRTTGIPHPLYAVIYSFHMPAFVFVTGVLSARPRALSAVILGALWPYLIAETLFDVLTSMFQGPPFTIDIARPEWGLWFLLSLFWWRLAWSLVHSWPRLAVATGALGLSLLIGYVGGVGHKLSVERTVVFLPFFLAGAWIGADGGLARVRAFARHWWIAAFVVWLIAVGAFIASDLPFQWLYFRNSFAWLGLDAWWAGAVRAALLLGAAGGTLVVLALTPDRVGPWTTAGAASLSIYVLHLAVLKIALGLGFADLLHHLFGTSMALWGAAALIASAVIVWCLSSTLARRIGRLIAPSFEGVSHPQVSR